MEDDGKKEGDRNVDEQTVKAMSGSGGSDMQR